VRSGKNVKTGRTKEEKPGGSQRPLTCEKGGDMKKKKNGWKRAEAEKPSNMPDRKGSSKKERQEKGGKEKGPKKKKTALRICQKKAKKGLFKKKSLDRNWNEQVFGRKPKNRVSKKSGGTWRPRSYFDLKERTETRGGKRF